MTTTDSPRVEVFHDACVTRVSPPPADASIPVAMAAAVPGKIITSGPTGGHVTVNAMPPDHVVLPHQHDCDEVIDVFRGPITLDAHGEILRVGDAVIVRRERPKGYGSARTVSDSS